MSTPSTTRSSLTSNANRGGRLPSQRSAATPPAAKQQAPAAAFPQPLPARFARLIDGVNVVSINVSYTRYGMTVAVILATGASVPLEQYEAQHKAVAAAQVLEKDLKLYRDRIAARQLVVPDEAAALEPLGSSERLQQWLDAWKGASPATFKILVMNNRNFRAQQGANAASA